MSNQDELHKMDAEQQLAAMGLGPEQQETLAAERQAPAMEAAPEHQEMPAAEQAPPQGGAAKMEPHQEDLHALDSEHQLAAMGLTAQEERTPEEALEPEQIAAMEAARQRGESP
jgi:hypothetical protein